MLDETLSHLQQATRALVEALRKGSDDDTLHDLERRFEAAERSWHRAAHDVLSGARDE